MDRALTRLGGHRADLQLSLEEKASQLQGKCPLTPECSVGIEQEGGNAKWQCWEDDARGGRASPTKPSGTLSSTA